MIEVIVGTVNVDSEQLSVLGLPNSIVFKPLFDPHISFAASAAISVNILHRDMDTDFVYYVRRT